MRLGRLGLDPGQEGIGVIPVLEKQMQDHIWLDICVGITQDQGSGRTWKNRCREHLTKSIVTTDVYSDHRVATGTPYAILKE